MTDLARTIRHDITTVAPVEEPITLTEVKEHCRVEHTQEDALFTNVYIPAARHQCEAYIQAPIIQRTLKRYFDSFGDCGLALPGNTQSITSVQYYDTANALQTWASSNYSLGNDALIKNSNVSFPSLYDRQSAIEVVCVCGLGTINDVPADLRLGLLHLVAHYYVYREVISELKFSNVPLVCKDIWSTYRKGRYF